jgi:hypothetical protein
VPDDKNTVALSAEELSNYNELLETSLFNIPEPFST